MEVSTLEFGSSQVEKARYWYEKLPYTYYTDSLSIGPTNIFSSLDVSKASNQSKYAILSDIASTQSSAVSLTLTQGYERTSVSVAAMNPNLSPIMTGKDSGLRTTGSLGITAANSSAAAIAPFQINYSVAVKKMSVADKVLFGTRMTAQEASLRNQYKVGSLGLHPLALSQAIKKAWLSQVTSEDVYATVNSSSDGNLQSLSPGPGEILVVTSLASELQAGDVGNLVTLSMNRDQDLNYVQVLADNMSLTNPFDTWIPVLDNLNLSISAYTATENIPVRMSVLHVKKSFVLSVLLGEEDPNTLSQTELKTYQEILAGVMI